MTKYHIEMRILATDYQAVDSMDEMLNGDLRYKLLYTKKVEEKDTDTNVRLPETVRIMQNPEPKSPRKIPHHYHKQNYGEPAVKQIQELMEKRPEDYFHIKDIAKMLAMKPNTVSSNLRNLEVANVVERKDPNSKTGYWRIKHDE
jgi:hypothetical protein